MNETTAYSRVSRGVCVPLTEHTFIQKPLKLLFYFRYGRYINNNKCCMAY